MQTLSDFFTLSGANITLVSMGRRVQPMAAETFETFERETLAWPLPWNGQAQVACVLRWPSNASDPAVWFLSLPLDEQGLISPAPRDAFLARLLQTLGTGESEDPTLSDTQRRMANDGADNLMQDNPLVFEPDLHQRALLHAKLTPARTQSPSAHGELARRYLMGDDTIHWQMIGLQGLADVVVAKDPDVTSALQARLASLPRDVLIPLCYLWEHGDVPEVLLPPLMQLGDQARESGDLERYCALLRAILGQDNAASADYLSQTLEDAGAMAPDSLAAIAARGWHHLEQEARLSRYLERLAEEPRLHFRRVVRDLALIPRLRLPILMMLRQAPVESAVGQRVAQWNV